MPGAVPTHPAATAVFFAFFVGFRRFGPRSARPVRATSDFQPTQLFDLFTNTIMQDPFALGPLQGAPTFISTPFDFPFILLVVSLLPRQESEPFDTLPPLLPPLPSFLTFLPLSPWHAVFACPRRLSNRSSDGVHYKAFISDLNRLSPSTGPPCLHPHPLQAFLSRLSLLPASHVFNLSPCKCRISLFHKLLLPSAPASQPYIP